MPQNLRQVRVTVTVDVLSHRHPFPEELREVSQATCQSLSLRLGHTARGQAARSEDVPPSKDTVWQGDLNGATYRVRRLDEDNLLAEQRVPSYCEDEGGAWAATDDGTAMYCFEAALLARAR